MSSDLFWTMEELDETHLAMSDPTELAKYIIELRQDVTDYKEAAEELEQKCMERFDYEKKEAKEHYERLMKQNEEKRILIREREMWKRKYEGLKSKELSSK